MTGLITETRDKKVTYRVWKLLSGSIAITKDPCKDPDKRLRFLPKWFKTQDIQCEITAKELYYMPLKKLEQIKMLSVLSGM
jgi:hypothetical protein